MIPTIDYVQPEVKVTMCVNAVVSETSSVSSGSSGCNTFGSSIRKAFSAGKLADLIERAEADYDAGRALDSLD